MTETDNAPESPVRLDRFDPNTGFKRGRPKIIHALWYLTSCAFFITPLPWPSGLKHFLLRLFGARLGRKVIIKPRVTIHFPWKLQVGDHSWLGDEVVILNFEPVKIGSNVCISQQTYLCCGNHNFSDPSFGYRNAPITVEDGSWIAARCFVGPGTTVQTNAVAIAGSVILNDLPAKTICGGNPCLPIKERQIGQRANPITI